MFIRFFHVTATVSITGVELFGGWVNVTDGGSELGGAILSSGNLTLSAVRFEECYVFGFTGIGVGAGLAAGGAIGATGGSLTLTDCKFYNCIAQAAANPYSSAHGGGIYSVGNVSHTFLRVDFELCVARNYPSSGVLSVDGCACELSGSGLLQDLYATTCTNSPGDMGAVVTLHEGFVVDRFSVYLSGSACLWCHANSTGAVLRNGTIRGSMQSDHAVICTGAAPASFCYCTIYDNYQNAEALFASGAAPALRSTIVAANSGHVDVAGAFVDLGFNLIGNVGVATGFSTSTLVGTPALPIDPKLSPLIIERRGRVSYCFIPLPGSPAIDAGGPVAGINVDQDSLPRLIDNAAVANAPGGDGSDIGAVEADAVLLEVFRPPHPVLGSGGTDVIQSSSTTLRPVTLTYEVRNAGSSGTVFGPGSVSVSLLQNCTASVVQQPVGALPPSALQVFVVELLPLAAGAFGAAITLDSDADFAPFPWFVSGNAVAPALAVYRSVAIPNGATDLLNGITRGVIDLTYTVVNGGQGELHFMGASAVTCVSSNNCTATVLSAPTMIMPGSTAVVLVRLEPQALGLFSTVLTLPSNDPAAGTFTVVIVGAALPKGEGAKDEASCTAAGEPAWWWLAVMILAIRPAVRRLRRT